MSISSVSKMLLHRNSFCMINTLSHPPTAVNSMDNVNEFIINNFTYKLGDRVDDEHVPDIDSGSDIDSMGSWSIVGIDEEQHA